MTWSSGTTLTLTATNSINVNAQITAPTAGLVLTADKDLNVNAVDALNLATISGSIGNSLNIQQTQNWTTPPDMTGLTAIYVNVNAPVTWTTGALALQGASINVNAPVTGPALTLNTLVDVNVNAVNALNVPTISGLINEDFNIQKAQSWTTPPDLTGLSVTRNFNVNAPLSWSSADTLTVASQQTININAPITAAAGGLALNTLVNVNVNAADALNVATIGGSISNNFNIQQAQAWTTPPDFSGLAVTTSVNVNAPLTWSTGTLALASTNSINLNASLTATGAGAGLALTTGNTINVNAPIAAKGAATESA